MKDNKYFGKSTRPLNPAELDLHNELGQSDQREAELKRRIEELEAVLKKVRTECDYDSYSDLDWKTARLDTIADIVDEVI